MDLYEHYKATQSLLGGHCISYFGFASVLFACAARIKENQVYSFANFNLIQSTFSCCLSLRYGTFLDVYKRRWSEILRFRDRSLFTSCEVCTALKGQLNDKALSMEQKLGALKLYRSHLHSQYSDRTVIWQLQSESADPTNEILLISTDGLDQSKFALPREPELRNNAALNLQLKSLATLSFVF